MKVLKQETLKKFPGNFREMSRNWSFAFAVNAHSAQISKLTTQSIDNINI